jgi:Na+-transporting NADH:ubiquinone oxidoreductase subunit E
MENLINIFIKSIFIENMVFAYFLGMCSYLAVSKSVKTATGLGLAVIFVLGITVPVNYLLENYILAEGAMKWLGSAFVRCGSQLSQLYHVYCRNCIDGTTGGDGC